MIIGICGFQSSGKDTIGEFLINKYGFKKLSFAGALKDIVSIMFGWSRDKLEGVNKEDREWREVVDPWWSEQLQMPNLTPRYVLQYFGTDIFRKYFHQDIWIKIVENQLIKFIEYNQNIVITDCRFKNEIDLISQYGGKIIHVYRNLPYWFEDYKKGIEFEEVKKLHPTETAWIKNKMDYDIENDKTKEELYKKIENIINN
jgi:hypothetical protein